MAARLPPGRLCGSFRLGGKPSPVGRRRADARDRIAVRAHLEIPMFFRAACLVAVALALGAGDARAIEMFTFFGDGSRIGLPSLEVPIEAYRGIPLRSDRLRARRRAMRQPPAQSGQLPAGVTIRSMPAAQPTPPPRQAPAAVRPVAPRGRPVASRPTTAAPIAPLPEDVMPPRGEAE
jgi:hypothetical protein